MSNALAIAATTLTLQSLLTRATPNVTVQPPDRARDAGGGDQLNLFLYQASANGALRNAEMPGLVRTGEVGHPPLPLVLNYLITAYADDEARGHAVLGGAMGVLHDHMLLGADEIRNATTALLPDSDLHDQLERVRITLMPLGLEELTKLWSGFQTQFRLSVGYEVSVVLIESTRRRRSPLPVLRRGPEDRGPEVMAARAPALTGVRAPGGMPGAPLGSTLTLLGSGLTHEHAVVVFRHPRLEAPIEVAPGQAAREGELPVTLPGDAEAGHLWPPGFYTVSLRLAPPGLPAWSSNEVPFALVPTATLSPATAPPGDLTLTVRCRPRLHDEQRALLLFGDRQVEPVSVTTPAQPDQPTSLEFHLGALVQGEYLVRLRVDGVDSQPVVSSGTPPTLQFDPGQRVVIS